MMTEATWDTGTGHVMPIHSQRILDNQRIFRKDSSACWSLKKSAPQVCVSFPPRLAQGLTKRKYNPKKHNTHLLVKLLDGLWVDNVGEVGDKVKVHLLDAWVVLGVDAFRVNGRDFRQALQRVTAERGVREKLVEKHINEMRLKHIIQRNPEQKTQKALERCLERRGVFRILHDKLTELVDELELGCEALFQIVDLLRRQLLERKFKHLLAQQLQNLHVVATQGLVGLARFDNLRDEILPVVGPLVFENLD